MRIFHMENVSKSFTNNRKEKIQAIKNVSFDVQEHEFISIIGPSGCGKSTLLKLISDLELRDDGDIIFDFDNTKDNLGFVFQDSILFPWKNVYDNIILPLEIKGIKTQANLDYIETLLKLVNLDEFRNSLPKELSGGMKQRASIARSLSYNPSLLLMDEPFGALDAITRDGLNVELRRIWKETNKTILFVTHDIEEAVFLSTKVIVLSNRPSTIREQIDIDLPDQRTLDIKHDKQFLDYVTRLRGLLND